MRSSPRRGFEPHAADDSVAEEKLDETRRRLEEKLDGEMLAAARDQLAELAELLDVELVDHDEDD